MRFTVTFSIPFGSSIPINYNYALTGLVYRLLGAEAPKWTKQLHDEGFNSPDSRKFKFFTFSQLFGGPGSTKAENRRLIFTTDTLRWTFGSALEELSSMLMDALLSRSSVLIAGMEATVQSVTSETPPSFSGEKNLFTCISPLVASVYDAKLGHKYLAPGDPLFWDVITTNLQRKWETLSGKKSTGTVSFTPDMDYIRRKRTSKAITIQPGEVVIGHLVPFSAQGPSHLLRLGYESGFGSRNSLGFGMAALNRKETS